MKKRLIYNFAILIIVFTTLPLFGNQFKSNGQPCNGKEKIHRGHRPPPFENIKFMKNKLKLSEKQIDKIININKKYRAKHIKKREKINPLKREIKKSLQVKKINFKKVKQLLTKISSLNVEIRMNMIKHRIEIEQILTTKQKKNMFKERRKKNRRNHER